MTVVPDVINQKFRLKGVLSSLLISIPLSHALWFVLSHLNNVELGYWLIVLPINLFGLITICAYIWPIQYYKSWLLVLSIFQILSIFDGCS